jgi:exocyst complex component 4
MAPSSSSPRRGGPREGRDGREARDGRDDETDAERQISNVLDHIRQEWPSMLDDDCVPVVLGLQLLDSSSVGRAHDYRKFRHTHEFLQRSLKNIVHEHHQGFNSSIGTFHKIQGSIQTSQKRVRTLKDSLAIARTSLCSTDPELKKLSAASQAYDEVLQVLGEVEELRIVPDQLEARISEKRFLTAVELLQGALRRMRRPEMDEIGALAELRNYLTNQETALQDILVEELHEHIYLKSPYCQERWQTLAKGRGAKYHDPADLVPFHAVLDALDADRPTAEDPAKNPESDTFSYIGLLVEALNRLGRLQNAVDTLKQRLPVELFAIVTETTTEVDNRHLKTLRNRASPSVVRREMKLQAEVIYDLLWTLYAKFEAIAEGQRVFHETVKGLIRREGAGNNSALLGSFKELWHLYQNEIRSLLHNYVTTDADVYHFARSTHHGASFGGGDSSREHLFKLAESDAKAPEMVAEMEALEGIMRSAVPGLTSGASRKGKSERRDQRKFDAPDGQQPSQKSLVEPSVFNMSLLLPPTLTFLQRLKAIVPPGSDLATSTLTTFLDNFLVNVFQPQLDETLGKLSDTIFGEPDSFLQDQDWRRVARRPVLKGATAFFDVVTAFCRMLGTIPHDQALSSLIVTQMNRYYERCLGWFRALVSQADPSQQQPQQPQQQQQHQQHLRIAARVSLDPGELHSTMRALWDESSPATLDKEVALLVGLAGSIRAADAKSPDKDMVPSLCLLYTSMKWLSVKIAGLRHITHQEADSSRPMTPRAPTRRWTLMSDAARPGGEQPVILPMTNETVQ